MPEFHQKPNEKELSEVADQASEIVKAGLPLISGLRALSEEVPSLRLRRTFLNISRELEEGESIERILTRPSTELSEHFRCMLAAGVRSGNLGIMLEHYLVFSRITQDLKRRIWLSLAYPLLLIILTSCLIGLLLTWIIPQFRVVFLEFDMELPRITNFLINLSSIFSQFGIVILLATPVTLFLIWFLSGLIFGQSTRRRFLTLVPIIGPMLKLSVLARFCKLLSILIESQVPIPESLRMAGIGCHDANLNEGCQLLAYEIEQGKSLSVASASIRQFPADLVSVFRWEQNSNSFADALDAAGEMMSVRARMQTTLVGIFCEPIAILFIAMTVGMTVLAMFMPLIHLLNNLS